MAGFHPVQLPTGTPLTVSNAGLYPTNYLYSAIGILKPVPRSPASGSGYDRPTHRSVRQHFRSASFRGSVPRKVGTPRDPARSQVINTTFQSGKYFKLPFEGIGVKRAQRRSTRFHKRELLQPCTESRDAEHLRPFSSAAPARVMQFALR